MSQWVGATVKKEIIFDKNAPGVEYLGYENEYCVILPRPTMTEWGLITMWAVHRHTLNKIVRNKSAEEAKDKYTKWTGNSDYDTDVMDMVEKFVQEYNNPSYVRTYTSDTTVDKSHNDWYDVFDITV